MTIANRKSQNPLKSNPVSGSQTPGVGMHESEARKYSIFCILSSEFHLLQILHFSFCILHSDGVQYESH